MLLNGLYGTYNILIFSIIIWGIHEFWNSWDLHSSPTKGWAKEKSVNGQGRATEKQPDAQN